MVYLLRNQTLTNLELIFIDDKGPDGSFAIAEQAARDDSRVKLIRNETNLGPGISRNKGIALATGEYLAFVDSDDIIPLDYYEKLYNIAKQTGAKVVKGGRINRYLDGREVQGVHNAMIRKKLDSGEHIMNSFGWEHTTAIYNRAHALENRARNSDAKQDEDTTFIMMVLHNLNPQDVVITDDTAYYYRLNENSITKTSDFSYLKESEKSLKDKLDLLLSVPATSAVSKYVSELIEGRLDFRYKRALDFPAISDSQRKEYVKAVCNDFKYYLKERPDCPMYGYSKKLATGALSIDEYMKEMQEKKSSKQLAAKQSCDSNASKSASSVQLSVDTKQDKSPHKKEIRVLGIPVWSKNTKTGRCVYRIFGIPVRHRKIR